MAKVVVTYEDNAEGGVEISVDLDPPIKGNEIETYAQYMALRGLEFARREGDEEGP